MPATHFYLALMVELSAEGYQYQIAAFEAQHFHRLSEQAEGVVKVLAVHDRNLARERFRRQLPGVVVAHSV
jgi:hypothetical protein